MIWSRSLGHVRNELVRIAVEERDVPLERGTETLILNGSLGDLGPGIEDPQFDRSQAREFPKYRRIVLDRMRRYDCQPHGRHGREPMAREMMHSSTSSL